MLAGSESQWSIQVNRIQSIMKCWSAGFDWNRWPRRWFRWMKPTFSIELTKLDWIGLEWALAVRGDLLWEWIRFRLLDASTFLICWGWLKTGRFLEGRASFRVFFFHQSAIKSIHPSVYVHRWMEGWRDGRGFRLDAQFRNRTETGRGKVTRRWWRSRRSRI